MPSWQRLVGKSEESSAMLKKTGLLDNLHKSKYISIFSNA